MPQNQITLPPIYVGAEPFDNGFSLVAELVSGRPGVNGKRFGPAMVNSLKAWDAKFKAGLTLVDANLNQEIANARGGQPEDINSVQGIHRELALREQLSNKKQAEIQRLSKIADQLYGFDPLTLTDAQQKTRILDLLRRSSHQEVHGTARVAYEAAYKRRFANEALGKLSQHQTVLRARLADTQRAQAEAAERAQAEAAARAAAERAQAEAAARAAAERAQAEAAARAAAERAQAEAAARAAAERAQAEATARAAAERAQAEAAAQAATERARAENQPVSSKEQSPLKSAESLYQFGGATTTSGAQLVTTAGRILATESSKLALQAAIRAAVGATAEIAAGAVSGFFMGAAALIYSSELGNGELPDHHAFALPLSDLGAPTNIGQSDDALDIPVRLALKAENEQTLIVAVPADGVAVSPSVRVVAAVHDAAQNVYIATTPDSPARTLTWTPVVRPNDSSTTLPVPPPPTPVYEGADLTPANGIINIHPELGEAGIDDYIFVFPADSGLPALYVVFRSPRDMPGVVSGEGQEVSASWLGALSEAEGAPVPKQIADQLRGRTFSSFSGFRQTLWKLVAADELLAKQFSPLNLAFMRKGYAPNVPDDQRAGKRDVWEIHHMDHIANGGAVYNVENLRIVTPKNHIKLHSGVKRG